MAKQTKQKSKRKKSKVLLFLVEGDSDIKTLELGLEQFLDLNGIEDIKLKFAKLGRDKSGRKLTGGDSTANWDINPDCFEADVSRMIDIVSDEGSFIYKKEVVKIVQIVDTDGAYVNDDQIVERECEEQGGEDRRYFEDHIETNDVRSTRRNLERKRTNLDYLSYLDKFKLDSKKVEYSIYYFSSNLEHFLYDLQNYDGDKGRAAGDFADAVMDDFDNFMTVMYRNEHLMQDKNYLESWDYIRQRGSNSLSRCSNINLMLDDLVAWGERLKEECI